VVKLEAELRRQDLPMIKNVSIPRLYEFTLCTHFDECGSAVSDYQQAPSPLMSSSYSSDGIFKGCTSEVSEELGTSAKSNSGQLESDLQPHSVNASGTLNPPPQF
jgi:hypothetical protein